MVITLSRNGGFFNTAYVLRKGGNGIQELRYSGTSKRLGYHYPKSMVWKDTLYVSYSTNKEDVEYTRVPLTSLVVDTSTVDISTSVPFSDVQPDSRNIKIYFNENRIINIAFQEHLSHGIVSIFNLNGQLLHYRKIYNSNLYIDMKQYPAGTYIIDVRTDLGRETQLFYNW